MPYEIFSILIGETKPFAVTLNENQTVNALQHAIKAERQKLTPFDADAVDLTLYLINATGSNHQERIEAVRLKSQNLSILQELDSVDLLADVFASSDGPPLRTIHVLVRTPEGESC